MTPAGRIMTVVHHIHQPQLVIQNFHTHFALQAVFV
jgi:hypothetical protein